MQRLFHVNILWCKTYVKLFWCVIWKFRNPSVIKDNYAQNEYRQSPNSTVSFCTQLLKIRLLLVLRITFYLHLFIIIQKYIIIDYATIMYINFMVDFLFKNSIQFNSIQFNSIQFNSILFRTFKKCVCTCVGIFFFQYFAV